MAGQKRRATPSVGAAGASGHRTAATGSARNVPERGKTRHEDDVMMRAIVLLLAFVTTGTAGAEEASINLSGIGSRTCAYWLSSRDHRLEGTVWIYGFWSGLNYVAASSEQDQPKTRGPAMIAAVESACKGKSSLILASAAWAAYIESNQR